MSEPLLEEQRENWGSRAGFVLAAIGSAVGLGNLWGFPYKVHANGGGAFLIPYLIAMLLIGIPLLILEFSLGHMTQRAAPDAYRGINRRTEPIGWWGIGLGFVIITYYAVILAWCVSYLIACITGIFSGGELPWAGEGLAGVNKAKEFFSAHFLNEWTAADLADGTRPWAFGGMKWQIVGSLALVWGLMYLCIFRGVRLVGKVVLWTVPLPWIMLLILTIRGLTLPGSAEGLNFYLKPEWAMLAKPETWRWAFGQMFFSMSLAFGVMITYASFLHRKSDINNNAAIIGLADVGTSFMAGTAVFATLGAMAYATAQAGAPVSVEGVVDGGPGLAFVAFPYALAQLPGSAWFGAVFFIALLTLGIDSAFSITESVLASIVDKTRWNRTATLVGMSLVGFGLGLVYCTRGGLNWLGSIDDFINSSWGGIALLGLLECVVVGWAYRISRLREHANERSDWNVGVWWDWIIRYVAPILLSGLFVWSLLDKFASSGGFLYTPDGVLNTPVLVGFIMAIAVPALSLILSFVHSPGADSHAAHTGQPGYGRRTGIVATIVVCAALAMIVTGFAWAGVAQIAGREFQAGLTPKPGIAPQIPHSVTMPATVGTWCLIAAFAQALAATVLGAWTVMHAEKNERRPSAYARVAAGWGVMGIGASAGVLFSLQVLRHGLDTAIARAVNPPAEVDTAAESTKELAAAGYVVLAVTMALLVIGLGWCFYRAIKAAGTRTPPTPQVAEGIDDA